MSLPNVMLGDPATFPLTIAAKARRAYEDLVSQEATILALLAELEPERVLERSGFDGRLADVRAAMEHARARMERAERLLDHRAARHLVRP